MSLPNVNELIVCRRKESQLEAFEIYLQYCMSWRVANDTACLGKWLEKGFSEKLQIMIR
jgi:hypothetical protein